MEYKTVNLSQWINENTIGSQIVVELGAGFFRRLADVNNSVIKRIGIEIYEPYIKNATYNNCIKIHGDALKYNEYVTENDYDTVLLVDILEHFNMEDGLNLINRLKKDFKKILLMLPVGKFEQNEDVTGHEGHEFQTHRSYWYEDDINKLNFSINIIDTKFHVTKERINNNLDTGCYFGVWYK